MPRFCSDDETPTHAQWGVRHSKMADKWSEFSTIPELKRPRQRTDSFVDAPNPEGGEEGTHYPLHPSKRTREEPEVPQPDDGSNARSSPGFKTLRDSLVIDGAHQATGDPGPGSEPETRGTYRRHRSSRI